MSSVAYLIYYFSRIYIWTELLSKSQQRQIPQSLQILTTDIPNKRKLSHMTSVPQINSGDCTKEGECSDMWHMCITCLTLLLLEVISPIFSPNLLTPEID